MPVNAQPFVDTALGWYLSIMAAGGGGAAIAWLAFKSFGDRWLQAQFDRKLADAKHRQDIEISRLRVEIDTLLSANLKLQEHEFSSLASAFEFAYAAYAHVLSITALFRRGIDVNSLRPDQLEDLLGLTTFLPSQKEEVRQAPDKTRVYERIEGQHQLQKVKESHSALRKFVDQKSLFIPAPILKDLRALCDLQWKVIVRMDIGRGSDKPQMLMEANETTEKEVGPLFNSIEQAIRSRLQSHRLPLKAEEFGT